MFQHNWHDIVSTDLVMDKGERLVQQITVTFKQHLPDGLCV